MGRRQSFVYINFSSLFLVTLLDVVERLGRSNDFEDYTKQLFHCHLWLIHMIVMTVYLTEAQIIGVNTVKSSGPKPFRKEKSSLLAVTLTDNDLNSNTPKTQGPDIGIVDATNTFLNLNKTITLLPSLDNKAKDTSKEEGSDFDTNDKSIKILEPTSYAKKPSSTLYVDSGQNIRQPGNSLRMGGTPACKMAQEENDDPYKLSASQFGFPKSIVNKALEESPFTPILHVMANQQYYSSYKQPTANMNDKKSYRKAELKGRIDQLSNHLTPPALSSFVGQPYDARGIGSDGYRSNPALYSASNNKKPNVQEDIRGSKNKLKSPFTNLRSNFNSYEGNNDNAENQFAPRLLDGSLFGSMVKPNNQKHEAPQYTQKNDTEETTKPYSMSDGNNDNDERNEVSKSNQDDLTIFNKNLPDVSGDDSWLSSTNIDDFNAFGEFGSDRTFPPKKNGFSGIIDMFPPKKSESLSDVPGLIDIIPKGNPVIRNSNKQRSRSNIGSPFEFDIKSIFGSIPSSNNIGSERLQQGSQSSTLPSSSSIPNSFGFFSNSNENTLGSPESQTMASLAKHIRFTGRRRRKRQTSQGNNVLDACKASYSVLRQYRHHQGSCFAVLPEVQGITFATCPKSSCAGCNVNGGTSRCSAVKIPMWVWAYCETGPNAGTVAPDRISVTVGCTCKVSYCRS